MGTIRIESHMDYTACRDCTDCIEHKDYMDYTEHRDYRGYTDNSFEHIPQAGITVLSFYTACNKDHRKG